jgi:HemY protein
MIRVLLFLALVAVLGLGVVWMADRPGDVAIVWQGYRIETSVMVAVVAVALVVLVAVMAWSIVRNILRTPDLFAMFLSHRRGVRGYLAISRGLIAVGAGDAAAAKRAAIEADRIAPGEPLALLLNAQFAQLSGDRAAAEHAFRAMAERDDTKLLGLRGLYIEAQRRKDVAAARAYAEEAANAAPALGWAGQAVLEFRCASGDWAAALSALDRNSRFGLIDKTEYKRQRAVLLTARALAAADGERDRARSLALDALKLAPTLVPAAELAGRLLGEAGELRRASRIIEKAWAANPHPDLAETYAHLRPGDSARERLARVQSLALKAPSQGAPHIESALAVARAALDAQWSADGFVSDRWMPVSPVSGRLDAFQWKVPLAELGDARAVIDLDELDAEKPPVVVPPKPRPPELPPHNEPPAPSIAEPVAPAPRPPAALAGSAPKPSRVETIIPLLHVPDDPGPEAAADLDPEPESPASSRGLRLLK